MTTIYLERLTTPLKFRVDIEEQTIKITASDDEVTQGDFIKSGDTLRLNLNIDSKNPLLLNAGIECLFGLNNECSIVSLSNGNKIQRTDFFQDPAHWTLDKNKVIKAQYPERSRLPEGVLYKKYIPQTQSTISYRLITENDLDIFHEWHNRPRVLHFWELNKPKEELLDYIRKGLKDPHQFPMIVEMNGEAFAYIEVYWAQDDRLGPYYESAPYDRGFHILVGNTKFLGHANTDALLKHTLHFLYLDDMRTERIMGEPRHDNRKLLKYIEATPDWTTLKIFDFPHKRAALIENDRKKFFEIHAI